LNQKNYTLVPTIKTSFSMKNLLSFVLFMYFSINIFSQNTAIPQSSYTVQFVSSDNTNHPAAHAFDGNTSTWWALYNSGGYSLPGIIEVDLGIAHDITGFSYLPNAASPTAKALDYEIYLSSDGTNWGNMDAAGRFNWTNDTDVSLKEVYFGAVSARYVKVKYLSNTQAGDNIHTGELVFFENPGAATGQINQVINFEHIPYKGNTSPDFEVHATSNSGLPVTFEIVSGPASINGNIISLSGTPGIVTVKALQSGNTTYYPAESIQSFEVLDLSSYHPTVTTRLTENYPIEMPTLKAYPIYIQASIDIPDNLLEVQNVSIEIDGTNYATEQRNNLYYYLWTPSSYGNHSINITATLNNGNTTNITRNIQISNNISTRTVTTLDDVVIQFGGTNSRWFYGTYTLPQFVSSYNDITAYFQVECPNISGGCDDWDRVAFVDVKAPDGNWIQLFRYITPYGVACSHQLNVTDYMSLLQGEVEFRVFIDTWGTGGWQLTLNLEYTQGTPTYAYSSVEEVWDNQYAFGDPANLHSVETYQTNINAGVQSSHLRLSSTGHGWGVNNSNNAAEFFNATHYINVNGNQTFTQHLWTNCSPNPDNCTGQHGTWYYNRAGWCPGTIPHPNNFDLSAFIGSHIDLDYRFHPSYMDNCHPNNPNCVSGTTCPNCNAGYNPFYIVDAQIINQSNQPIVYGAPLGIDFTDNIKIYNLKLFPNPSDGQFYIQSDNFIGMTRLSINSIEGKLIKTYFFKSSDDLNNYRFNLRKIPKGIYFINIENAAGTGSKKLIIR